jgi:hypothetical protein
MTIWQSWTGSASCSVTSHPLIAAMYCYADNAWFVHIRTNTCLCTFQFDESVISQRAVVVVNVSYDRIYWSLWTVAAMDLLATCVWSLPRTMICSSTDISTSQYNFY